MGRLVLSASSALGLLLLLVAIWAPAADAAIKWNLTASIQSTLPTWIGYPPDDPACTAVGVCKPFVTVIPNNTVWIWCGWSTKYRTQYWVPSYGPNVSVTMMREAEVNNCALDNLSKIKNCQFLADTTCDTSTNCVGEVWGMSFVDASCVLVANNDKKPANVSIQVWQYSDPARNVGTVFSIILLIIILGFSLGHMGYTCYHQIKKPSHRLDELEKLTRAKLARDSSISLQELNPSQHRDASEVGPGPAKEYQYGDASAAGGAGTSAQGADGARAASAGGAGGQPRVGVALGGAGEQKAPGLIDRIVNMVAPGGASGKGGHAH